MPGTLFVVATPIGNLEDITLRALRVLREADLIAAEDTRRTARLLAHHGIGTPTLSFHAHNWRGRLPQLLARLESGQSVAAVTDAGTPGISDPGVELVAACVAARVPVDPVPGVSAPIVAAVASGFPLSRLTIFGFPPVRSKDRSLWLGDLAAVSGTSVFFEAPHRMAQTLAELDMVLGERQICVGREMTKVHQEFIHGTPRQVCSLLKTLKGEFTVVVGPPDRTAVDPPAEVEDSEIAAEFGRTTETTGISRREALQAVAAKFGKRPKDVYSALERVKRATS